MPTITPTKDGHAANALSIEYLSPLALVPYPDNPRTHRKSQVRKLAASITAFGFVVPVLIDGQNGLICGHGRLQAAKSLSLEVIPCLRVEHLTNAQKRAFRRAEVAETGTSLTAANELAIVRSGSGKASKPIQTLQAANPR